MPTQRQSSNQGFLETCIGVIFNPFPTMRTIVRRRPIGWALIVIIVITVAQGITGAASLDPADFDDVAWVQGPLQGFSIVGGPALAIAVVAFFTAICWIMSWILGGPGIVRRSLCRIWVRLPARCVHRSRHLHGPPVGLLRPGPLRNDRVRRGCLDHHPLRVRRSGKQQLLNRTRRRRLIHPARGLLRPAPCLYRVRGGGDLDRPERRLQFVVMPHHVYRMHTFRNNPPSVIPAKQDLCLAPSPVAGESLPRTRYGGWGEGESSPC